VVTSASVEALNARSTGLPLQFAADYPRTVQWILLLIMAIGVSPGGTGGGIKTTTLATLYRGTADLLRGIAPRRAFGIAIAWTAAFAAVVFVALLSLLHSEPDRQADYLLSLAVSATGNVGLAHDRVTVVGQGMTTLTIAMFLGRALPALVLWWMV